MCSKLIIKTPEQRQWRRTGAYFAPYSSVSIVNFDHATAGCVPSFFLESALKCLSRKLTFCDFFMKTVFFS